ncbi:MAG: hypothetical protein HFH14_00120 [Lachnospiraceae bacterium]|nr:hypothetical protein [Lachnospiraceae bacterium]
MASLTERSKEARLEKQKKKRKIVIIIAVIAAAAAVMLAGWFIIEAVRTKEYTGYSVIKEFERQDSNTVCYRYYDGDLLKYSHDGASALGRDGNALWNGSYDIKEPLVDVCDRYVAIADMGGKEIYIFNGSDTGTSVTVPYPIASVKIAGQGVVAAILEDETSNVIHLYNPYSQADKLLAEVPTNIVSDGYPLEIALSPDGQSLVTTYLNVESGGVQSNVCFYNFSEVGQEKNRMVGGIPYKDSLVTDIDFCGGDSVCIWLENGFSIYSNMKEPKLVHEELFEEEIVSVVNSDKYIGVVFEGNGENSKRNFKLYNIKGNKILDTDISYEYNNLSIVDEDIIFYNDMSCAIMRVDGSEKFCHSFDWEIDYFIKADDTNSYYIIDAAKIYKVKLTED